MQKFVTTCLLLMLTGSALAARVDTVEVYSESMRKKIKAVVITPDAYSSNPAKKFPVLYLLHGYSDSYNGWVKKAASLLPAVDESGIIVVCPDGGFGSWYFDSPIDSAFKYETHITREVLNYTDKHYRTIAEKSGRAIAGLSMGGHGALYLASRHKDLYGACIVLSGGVDITPFPNNWDLAKRLGPYESNRLRWVQHSALYWAHQLNNKDIDLRIDCGTGDFFIGVNRILHQQLLELKIDHDYIERPGGHNWAYWNNAIPYHLYHLKQHFNKETGSQSN